MKKDTSIGIGLHVLDQVIDLQIPKQVTVFRLKQLLKDSLLLIAIKLPEIFEISVLNKPIRLDDSQLIANYPLGDGDQLIIIENHEVNRG